MTWQTVTVPHDWSVAEPFSREYSSGTGYVAGGIGWYRKAFALPEECRGKKVFITFDGVYNNSQAWCNGNNLGKRPYGYSSFTHDITPFCVFGAGWNVVAVKVSHVDLADSRWFTGSGIYRDVRVTVTDRVHLAEYSPFVSTAGITGDWAVLSVEARVVNETDASREVLVRHAVTAPDGKPAGAHAETVTILPGGESVIRCEIPVESPRLWSTESPALYSVLSEIVDAKRSGAVLDARATVTGIRQFSFDPARGFFLNGVGKKLKGVCVHHDAGCLGAAVPRRVWAQRLRLLREMGCNAIRMSHNPPDPKLLDLCDSMGFLVIDEAFDEWEGVKNKWSAGHNVYPPKHFGYGDDFPVWHEADLKAMVFRDRNHPSILLWSIGNEVDYPNDPYCHPFFAEMVGNNDANKPAEETRYDPSKPNAERLAGIAKELVAIVKACDPTRPVTAAIAFPELSNLTGYCDALDVVGYNYRERFYASDRERYPDRVLFGSENGASYEQWLAVRNSDCIPAQFVWTGIDYLGEAKGWPVRANPAGFIDLAGFPKPKYFFRKSLWRESPVLYLSVLRREDAAGTGDRHLPPAEHPCWDWADGEDLEVRCYTNLAEVSLSLNGSPLGRKRLADSSLGYLSWNVRFAPGALAAVSECDGSLSGPPLSCELCTPGKAAALKILQEPESIDADGTDTARIEIGIVDADGRPVYGACNAVTVAVEGPAALMGLENGDIGDVEPYASPCRNAFHGRLAAYVRSTAQPGMIRVLASSPGLEPAEAAISSGRP